MIGNKYCGSVYQAGTFEGSKYFTSESRSQFHETEKPQTLFESLYVFLARFIALCTEVASAQHGTDDHMLQVPGTDELWGAFFSGW